MQTIDSIVYLIVYVVFFGFSWFYKNKGIHRLIDGHGGFTTKPRGLIGSHLFGIILLGIIPAILMKKSILRFITDIIIPDSFFIVLYFLTLVLIITIAINQSKKAYKIKLESTENGILLSSQFFISYFVVRAFFLFSYELWFRGFLLFDSIHWFGVLIAVFMNVSLYVFVHIFNSKKEILACFPFGLLVCFFSILFNTALAAIILHIGFSLAYEINFYRLSLINSKIVKS